MLSVESKLIGIDQRASAYDASGPGLSASHAEGSSDGRYTDIRACIVELESIFRSTWEPRRFQIAVRLQPGLPDARCDRQGLQNALLNLAFNARDAMPDGGVISIEAVTADHKSEAMIELRIEDEGVGMSQETMLRAFEPFFTTKSKGLGGVGLPMVKHFVESHGGSIRIHSVWSSGTTVVLSLPARR